MNCPTTTLTRATIAAILGGVSAAVFGQYQKNPEDFIHKASPDFSTN